MAGDIAYYHVMHAVLIWIFIFLLLCPVGRDEFVEGEPCEKTRVGLNTVIWRIYTAVRGQWIKLRVLVHWNPDHSNFREEKKLNQFTVVRTIGRFEKSD